MSVRGRSNGLSAASYVPLARLDAPLVDPLLTALAAAQVAAFVDGLAGGDAASPELTVHVDATRRPQARAILGRVAPHACAGLPTVAEEVAFAELVAAFAQPSTDGDWPAAEDLAPRPPRPEPVPPSASAQAAPRPADGADQTATADDPADELAEDEDHYEPPELDPLPPTHPTTRWGLIGLLSGFAVLLVPTFLGAEHQTSLDIVGVLAIVGSLGLLVARLRDGRSDDPDDGAVV